MIVLFSGGADSATLLLVAKEQSPISPIALSFNYGQTHAKELEYARRFCEHYDIEQMVIPLPVFSGSALTGDADMPHGHYTDESMQATVVPNRNMVMLAIAASIAVQRQHSTVAYAAHLDDQGVYPDCRPGFIHAMRDVLAVCDYKPIALFTPFAAMSKKEIIKLGRKMGLDYSMTWSCYTGGAEPCGTCGACSARQTAMENA